MSTLQTSCEINQVLLDSTLPNQIEVVCLRPKGYEYRTADTSAKEQIIHLNTTARKLRRDKEKPLIADVLGNHIVVLPWSEAEGRQMLERGLDKKDLEATDPPTMKISIEEAVYRRLLLRAVEISLRNKGYTVNEVSALKYQGASTSYAFMYSSGISAKNKFFEVYRGAAFRVLIYPIEKKASLIIDPTFHFLPRATLQDLAKLEHNEVLRKWGGAAQKDGEITFDPPLEVVDVCPIPPEDCRFRISPYESDCLLYNPQLDMAVSCSRPCLLQSIKKAPITQEPRIRKSVKNCNTISSHIPDDTVIAVVTFYGSTNTYFYPLQRLRSPFKTDLVPDLVTLLGGNDQDISTVNGYFDRIVKMPPNERRWYTYLFVNDLMPFRLGTQTLSFKKSLTMVGMKQWK